MNKSSINKLKKRLLGIVTATSIAMGGFSPAAGLTAYAAENTELSQISGFKQGWSWVIGTEAAAIDELQSADSLSQSTEPATLPVGNAGSSSAKCKAYIESGGTVVGTSKSTKSLVLQKTVNIDTLDDIAGFAMDAQVDDGAVVFVNSKPALSFNAKFTSSGTSGVKVFGYEKRYVINDPIDQVNKSTFEKLFIGKDLFHVGENIITVAVLQDSATSGDILFDAMLYSIKKGCEDTVTPSGFGIDYGDEWLWIKNDCESAWLSDDFIPTAAESAGYNSNAWRKGNAPFGYNTNDNSKPVTPATTIPHPAVRPPSASDANYQTNDVYLRRIIEIDDIDNVTSQYGEFTMNISRVRNVTVYLNGENVYTTTDGTNNDMRSDVVVLPTSKLKTGKNVISVDLKNSAPESSCMYFDMELIFGKEFSAKSFAMTPGKTETEMGFLWYTPKTSTAAEGAAVKLVKTSDYAENGFKNATVVKGTATQTDDSQIMNKVTATGLERGTQYAYCYGNTKDDLWSEVSTFRTGGDNNKIIFVGDPTIGGESGLESTRKAWAKNLSAAESKVPDAGFILTDGDCANDKDVHYEYLKEPDQFKRLPFASTIGNHETNAFPNQFNFPNWTGLGSTSKGCDYYFSYGNTLYILLNSFNYSVDEHKKAMEQAIASHPDAKWRVVVTHFDVYGAGPHASGTFIYWPKEMKFWREQMTPVYDEFGIDFVFNGHDHSYARSHFMKDYQPNVDQIIDSDGAVVNPNGTLYVTATCGSDGRFYSPIVKDSMNWVDVTKDYQEPQFTVLETKGDTFSITTYLSSDINKVVDTITVRKKDSEPKTGLRDELSAARKVQNSVSAGDKHGQCPQEFVQKLNDAIEYAKVLLAASDPGEQEMNEAIANLQTAAKDCEANIIPYTITYKMNFGSDDALTTVNIKQGEKFTVAENLFTAPAGMSFVGWNTYANGKGKTYKVGEEIEMPARDITLYAQWKSFVTGITLDKSSLNIAVNASADLKAVLTPSNITDNILWTSSDTSVAVVDQNGRVTGIKKGVVAITASYKSDPRINALCTVTVTDSAPTIPANGTKVVNGKTVLYQNSKAVSGTKVVTVGGKTYAVVKGYVKTGAKTQLVKIGKKTYVVDKSGVVIKAKANKFVKIGAKTYVLSKNGTIVKPSKNKLVKVGKKSYIVDKNGVVLKNKKSVKVGKKTYKTDKKGIAIQLKKK